MPLCFYKDNVLRLADDHAVFCFNRYRPCLHLDLIKCLFHVSEQSCFFNRLRQIPKHMEFHRLIQIIHIRCENEYFNRGIFLLQFFACINTAQPWNLHVEKSNLRRALTAKQRIAACIRCNVRHTQVCFLKVLLQVLFHLNQNHWIIITEQNTHINPPFFRGVLYRDIIFLSTQV